MLLNYIIFILLIFPLFYKLSFWLYAIQLKEYRRDRFKEYILTPQGKKAIFNKIMFPEIIILIIIIAGFFVQIIYDYLPYIVLIFMILENSFFSIKMVKTGYLKPEITPRMKFTISLIVLFFCLDILFLLLFFDNLIFLYSILVLLLPHLIVGIVIFITLPIVNHKKNKIIKSAIYKSKKDECAIKIGITGSYGKSSVKDYLCHILENEGNLLCTPDNINSELGVSKIVLDELNDNYNYFVAEMGAYRMGEIRTLGDIVNHKYGFITGIGNQHLGLFGSQMNIINGKFEIIERINRNNGTLYVNFDSIRKLPDIEEMDKINIVKYGIKKDDKDLDAKSSNIKVIEGKTNFNFSYKENRYNLTTNLLGHYNVLNLTGIIAFSIDFGIDIDNIKKYLLSMKGPKNTMDIQKGKFNTKDGSKLDLTIIDDTHNLSEQGLITGISVLNNIYKKQGEGVRYLVLDDILELGKRSEDIHFKLGERIAKHKLVDKVMFVGINYKDNFIKGLKQGGFTDDNIALSSCELGEHSVILFEGKKAKDCLGYFIKV